MLTVEYDDEDPVSYRRWADRYLLEALKYGLGLTIREVYPMLQKMLTDGLDPIIADGEEFELGGLLDVPPPNAKLNLLEAISVAERDAKTCEMLLSGEVDRAELVLRNSIEWARFWSVRSPSLELREIFAKTLRRLETGRGDGGDAKTS
jgi:hypothetical protein